MHVTVEGVLDITGTNMSLRFTALYEEHAPALSFTWNGTRITWMFAQTPAIFVAMWLVAGAFWAAYLRQRCALRASEL